jgi:hypothetical protein
LGTLHHHSGSSNRTRSDRTYRDRYNAEPSEQEDYSRPIRRRRQHRHDRSGEGVFKCHHCRRFIGPVPYGGYHRNHCPFCLYSLHVDVSKGDRRNDCGARMEPIGFFQRPNGEYVLLHRCLGCGEERINRIAADDDFDLVLTLPRVTPRTSQDMKLQRLQEWFGETSTNDGMD